MRYDGQREAPGCACDKMHPHIVDLVCPTCQIKIALTMPISFTEICYICTQPLKDRRNTICTTCSFISKHCARCKFKIKSGNEYIDDLYSMLEKTKFRYADTYEEHIKIHMENMINILGSEIDRLTCEFDNKNARQMQNLLIVRARLECEHCE